MPSPESFKQEVCIWRELWEHREDRPENITFVMFPNTTKVLNQLALPSMTSSTTERANSPLHFIKKCTCNEEHIVCREVNSLLLLYVQKDISLDYADIGNDCARRNPRTTYTCNCFIILM